MDTSEHPSTAIITDGLKIVHYSLNSSGAYEQVAGFICPEVEVANHQAWREIDRQIAGSREKVRAGRVSCLHFYMTVNLMDIGLLARYTGQSRWKVRLHMFPFIFSRLSCNILQIYAQLFKIFPDDLIKGRLLLRPSLNNLEGPVTK
ncbi:MAG: hypothetical protein ACYDBT_00910 [Desulfobulbaceae bacterium]